MNSARIRPWLAPVLLFGLAVVVRLWAAGQIGFPVNEGSASYVGVARNLVEGRGLVSDAIWSYATPPLVLPKPAFELWMPMASFLAAIPMTLLGTTFSAAQLSSVLFGAAVAPLTWWVAREAARHQGLETHRAAMVALGSGLAAAFLGPFLVAAAMPDSTTPFLVFGVAAAIAMASMLRRPTIRAGLLLGVLLGLAYLSRQEALEFGAAYALLVVVAVRGQPGRRLAGAARLLLSPLAGGLIIVVPWFLRDLSVFGTLFPGQTLENAYLSTNEQIFAYAERPTAATFLAQGPSTIVGHMVGGLAHDLVNVIVLPGLPVGIIGILAVVAMRRAPAFRQPTALQALLVSGLLIYLVSSLVVPVATLWGTFLHASGPLLVGLTVAAMLGLDAAVARLGRLRGWSRPNAWLGPLLALALAIPFAVLQVSVLGQQASDTKTRLDAIVAQLAALPEIQATAPAGSVSGNVPQQHAVLISDHPIWLAEALRRPVIALPDEPPGEVAALGRDFGTVIVVEFDQRGRYPAEWLASDAAPCLAAAPQTLPAPGGSALLVRLAASCTTP